MRIVFLFLLFVAFGCEAQNTNQLIGFRYVKSGNFQDYRSYATVFYATNYTTNMLRVNLASIEVKKGTNWIVQFISPGIYYATNQTMNVLRTNLPVDQVTARINWIPYALSPELWQRDWQFASHGGSPIAPMFLNPHKDGYATVELPIQPSGTIWRVKVSVAPILTGSEDKIARVKLTPEFIGRRLRTGNTKIPINLFGANMYIPGKPTEVISQEILEE
jgi:hypothetical protein